MHPLLRSDRMGKYVAKRIFQVIPTLFFVILTIFLLMKLIPGDPAMVLLGPQARTEDIVRFKQQLGLDKPVPIQFLIYLKRAITGDLGNSLVYKQSVLSLIFERLPVTITLSVCPDRGNQHRYTRRCFGSSETQFTHRSFCHSTRIDGPVHTDLLVRHDFDHNLFSRTRLASSSRIGRSK